MTGRNDATLQSLRLTYNAALAAHQGCIRALTEARMAGTAPSAALVENEARARRVLQSARERLLAGMTQAITGQVATPSPEQAAANEPPDAPT